MRALLIFGKRFGTDNAQLLDLGRKIGALGHQVTFSFQWDDRDLPNNFDIMIGHSFGGDIAVFCAKLYRDSLSLKYLALIDPVDPAWFPFGLSHYWKKFQIPSNVQKADCFTRLVNFLPPAGKIANPSAQYVNHEGIASSHANMPGHPFVVDTILSSIKLL